MKTQIVGNKLDEIRVNITKRSMVIVNSGRKRKKLETLNNNNNKV